MFTVTNNYGNLNFGGNIEADKVVKFVSTVSNGEINLAKDSKIQGETIRFGTIRGAHVNDNGAVIIEK